MDLTVGLVGSGADRIVAGTAEDEINQALADIGAAGGGTVTVLQGTYSLASGISIDDDNVTLKGAGAGQTILRTNPGYPVGTSPIIAAVGVDNLTIQDLTVDGHTNDTQTNGIVTTQCSNSVISGCEVLLAEAHNYGIWVVLSDHIQVLDNSVDGVVPATGQEGIETWSSDNVLISGNTIKNIGGSALNLASVPTPSYGDIQGQNTNIQALDNIIENSTYGATIGVAGPRSFGQIEVQGNTFTNVIVGVRLFTVDRMGGAPDSESATIADPQSLHDIDISDNRVNLYPSSAFAIFLQNISSPDVTIFSNLNASDNVISDAPGEVYSVIDFDNFTLDDNIITGTTQDLSGSAYRDIILGSNLADVISGGGGADTFVFDLNQLNPAGVVDHIVDYNQGNSGMFNPAEGDSFDFSALLSAVSGQSADNLVRVLENPGGTGAILQIDQNGLAGGADWTTIATLDGVDTAQGVKVVVDSSQPAATVAVRAFTLFTWDGASAADFNGDGKADILGQNEGGLPTISMINGSTVNGTALANVGPSWHVAATADFSGDGKADILWQNDSGLPAIWTMNGTTGTGYAYLPDVGPTWNVAAAADFNGDGKADILWQNDNGSAAIWTMKGSTAIGFAMLPDVGPAWHVAAAADFTGDGKADILWQNDSGRTAIWTMNGNTPIGYATLADTGPTWHVAAAADFNGDSSADILWQNDSGRAAIWTMKSGAAIGYATLPDIGSSTWHVAAAADFNGDHKADILWQDDSGMPAIWTMNGSTLTASASLPDVGSDWHLV